MRQRLDSLRTGEHPDSSNGQLHSIAVRLLAERDALGGERDRLSKEVRHLTLDRDLFYAMSKNLRSGLDLLESTLAMTVDRLGGEVEGAPTHCVNFLQRIDALRAIESERDRLAQIDATEPAPVDGQLSPSWEVGPRRYRIVMDDGKVALDVQEFGEEVWGEWRRENDTAYFPCNELLALPALIAEERARIRRELLEFLKDGERRNTGNYVLGEEYHEEAGRKEVLADLREAIKRICGEGK